MQARPRKLALIAAAVVALGALVLGTPGGRAAPAVGSISYLAKTGHWHHRHGSSRNE